MEVNRLTSEAGHILADGLQKERLSFTFESQMLNCRWQYHRSFSSIVQDRVGVKRLVPMADDDWHHLEVDLSSLLGVGEHSTILWRDEVDTWTWLSNTMENSEVYFLALTACFLQVTSFLPVVGATAVTTTFAVYYPFFNLLQRALDDV